MAASAKKLGDLHEVVANAFYEQVVGFDEEDENGVVHKVRPSPSLLGAATAFLKNNNVTADVEDNAALRELSESLKARRQKKLPPAMLDEAADAFAERFGGGMIQ